MLPKKQKSMIEDCIRDLYKSGDELRLTIDNGDYRSLLFLKGEMVIEYSIPEKYYDGIFRIIYQVYTSEGGESATSFDIGREQHGIIFFEVDEENNIVFGENKFNPYEKISFNKKKYTIKTEPNLNKNSFSFSLIEYKKKNKIDMVKSL
jgi:hypothetical protein